MLMLVSYDVSTVNAAGRRRLRQIAKACQDRGVRVQNSVFECNVDAAQWVQLKAKLEGIFEPETDSLRQARTGCGGAPGPLSFREPQARRGPPVPSREAEMLGIPALSGRFRSLTIKYFLF